MRISHCTETSFDYVHDWQTSDLVDVRRDDHGAFFDDRWVDADVSEKTSFWQFPKGAQGWLNDDRVADRPIRTSGSVFVVSIVDDPPIATEER